MVCICLCDVNLIVHYYSTVHLAYYSEGTSKPVVRHFEAAHLLYSECISVWLGLTEQERLRRQSVVCRSAGMKQIKETRVNSTENYCTVHFCKKIAERIE